MDHLKFWNTIPFKIIVSFIVLFLYYYLSLGWIGYLIIFAIISFSIYAFFSEKKSIESGNVRFRKNNLFFRYGFKIASFPTSLPTKDSWNVEETTAFGDKLTERIKNKFLTHYGDSPLRGKQIISIVNVTDSERPSDSRGFLKISFTGSRGAIFTWFITYELVGNCIVLYRMVFLLGIAHWYDLLFFFVTSPITILFWFYRWIKGEYDIYARVSRGIGNSFEVLDVQVYYESSDELITKAIVEELDANGLLPEPKMQEINNIFNFNGNFTQTGNNNSIVGQIK